MRILLCAAILIVCGCSAAPDPRPENTGSREAAAEFFQAIAAKDWPAAFSQLHSDSKKNLTQAAFTTRAQAYRKNLGFDLGKVHVGICEEQGDTANAHLTLAEANNSRKHRYREAIVVRKSTEGWRVVLPANFGSKR